MAKKPLLTERLFCFYKALVKINKLIYIIVIITLISLNYYLNVCTKS